MNRASVVFERVVSGKPYNSRLKLYSKSYLTDIVNELEIDEEYEKCHILTEYIKSRFDHNLNYKNPIK